MTAEANVHATCIVLGDRGLLIEGESGSGKSGLALHLIAAGHAGTFARLVADDRVLLRAEHGRLVARPPAPIEGLVELWGHGPVGARHASAAVVDCVVRLVPHASLSRMPEPRATTLLGVTLPCFEAPSNEAMVAARIVMTALAATK